MTYVNPVTVLRRKMFAALTAPPDMWIRRALATGRARRTAVENRFAVLSSMQQARAAALTVWCPRGKHVMARVYVVDGRLFVWNRVMSFWLDAARSASAELTCSCRRSCTVRASALRAVVDAGTRHVTVTDIALPLYAGSTVSLWA